ncbi:MAG: eukaryotic-like serine/threonine-protein kinase [Solirubrobacteraceae bacterium]|nr:eukaryotic-like serine/threonine-protein kinase [Solirubrobacteraceae bacterium]
MPLASQIELPERYRVARHIASGGMASVWEAEDLLLGRVVAVKVLAAQYAADPAARARFQREARTAAQVSDQSHVVTIYDIGEHADDAFIVMEYFAGGTVADRLRAARKDAEPIAHETALRWLSQAAAGLDVAHAAGIVHRDVKPANLLLDAQGRLAVADFGIARLADDTQMTQTGQVLGTAAYISPEQAMGQPATAASDRYALAVVAYELLTGSRPFRGGPPTAQALAHAESDPPRPSQASPDLPRAVDAVLLRGLAKDPDERPATATEFVAAIERALEPPAPVDPTRAFAAVEPTKPTERVDGSAGAAIAGLAAGALGADGAAPAPGVADLPLVEDAHNGVPDAPANLRQDAAAPRAAEAADARQATAADAQPPTPPAPARPRAIAPQPARPAARSRQPDAPPHAAPRRRAPAPALIGAALAAVAAVVLVLALTSGNDPVSSADRGSGASTQPDKQRSRTATTAAQTPPPAPPPAAAAAPATAKGAESASQLNERGHQLNNQGRYAEAVAPLRQSVAAYEAAGQKDINYAYAIFNLAVALNRSGNPAEAIPLLHERLQYDDQPETVQAELRNAEARLAGATGGKPAKGNGKGKNKNG